MIAVHLQNQAVSLRRKPKPRLPAGHALLRLITGGICNTDIELLRGYYSFSGTPGHEFVAEVVQSDDPRWTGKRVTGEINLPCRNCPYCARGLGRHCPTRTVLGIVKHPGAFSEFFTLPLENLHPIPDSVPTRHAVFTEPVAAACEILDQVKIPRRTPFGVLGDGKLGLLIACTLAAHGAEVHLYGRHRSKLSIAESAGVHTAFSNKLPRAAYEYTVDATGSPDGLMSAVGMTRPRGTLILKSTVHGAVPLDAAPIIVNEITLIGSRCGRFEPALKLIKSGKLPLERMISAEFPLSEAPQAFALAQEKGILKVLLQG